jgi:DnaK suppressor protein
MKAEHARSLTQAQRDELKQLLEAKRQQLLDGLRKSEGLDEIREADSSEQEPGDAADFAEVSTEQHERIALADRDLELLEEVEAALGRFARGTYGVSETSKRPIPFERLRAVPWTRFDASEAERIEHARRH